MFKETEAEAFWKKLSTWVASKVLSVSRNKVAVVQALFLQPGRSWDNIHAHLTKMQILY